ncbi:hypothetical protein NDU88_001478 [Pleurodeles waltl]|uniref:Uncharacterized protein n=1 Tax=Pleurodeles waltl TaxID=8319 RepID=A0AAV7S928_PLEWA|nr:hypothetical protein NDU88_001478 [Pleurodeles waltl]
MADWADAPSRNSDCLQVLRMPPRSYLPLLGVNHCAGVQFPPLGPLCRGTVPELGSVWLGGRPSEAQLDGLGEGNRKGGSRTGQEKLTVGEGVTGEIDQMLWIGVVGSSLKESDTPDEMHTNWTQRSICNAWLNGSWGEALAK